MKSGGGGGGGGGGGSPTKPPSKLTTTLPTHRLPCTLYEKQKANCRNGGTCYVVILQNLRNEHCRYCIDRLYLAVQSVICNCKLSKVDSSLFRSRN